MDKISISRALALKDNLSVGEADDLVNALIKIIKDTLENGEEVLISGFGRFALREKKARPGRDPKTMEPYEIDARRVVKFLPSKVWREDINGV